MYKTAARKKLLRACDYDLYDDFEKIKEAFADATHDAKDKTAAMLVESLDGLKERSVSLEQDAIDLIREKPVKAVGIAAITGMCLGLLVSFIIR